jgi:uncharacterized protein YjbI with pentapeptide repeats
VNCSFFDVTLIGCKLLGSTFERCTYALLKVHGGDWSFVEMRGAALKGAHLTGVRMREADLSGAQLDEAVLHGVDLSGAWLHGTNLRGTDLRGSQLPDLDPTATDVRGAMVTVEQAVEFAISLGLDVRPGADPEK